MFSLIYLCVWGLCIGNLKSTILTTYINSEGGSRILYLREDDDSTLTCSNDRFYRLLRGWSYGRRKKKNRGYVVFHLSKLILAYNSCRLAATEVGHLSICWFTSWRLLIFPLVYTMPCAHVHRFNINKIAPRLRFVLLKRLATYPPLEQDWILLWFIV